MTAIVTPFPGARPRRALQPRQYHAPTTVTIVVPTYKESANLAPLIDRIAGMRRESGLPIDLLIVDDNSNDGSVQIVAARREPWVRFVIRTASRDVTDAILEGMRL